MIGIIVEAQTNIDDIPNRIFYKFGKKSVVARVLNNCAKSDFAHKVILSMPSADKSLIHGHVFQDSAVSLSSINYMDRGITTNFYGRHDEQLSRIYHAAINSSLTTIVRVNAENVLLPTWLINQAILYYFREARQNEFVVVGQPEYSDGFSVEIFPFYMLADANISCDNQDGLSSYLEGAYQRRLLLNQDRSEIVKLKNGLRFDDRSKIGIIGSILEEVDLGADVGAVINDLAEGGANE
jgi:spore coat polysaccharide biosynthesis protein SpsF (cytidylyltransferase family)